MVTIQLTDDELKSLRLALEFFTRLKDIISCFQSDELIGIKDRVNELFFQKEALDNRAKLEANMRSFLTHDPDGLSRSLKNLDRDFPLPGNYQ